MSPRKRVRFSDSVVYFGRTRASTINNCQKSSNNNDKGNEKSGNLRLPLETLKLLMRKCHVKLTRCDDQYLQTSGKCDNKFKKNDDISGKRSCRRASESNVQLNNKKLKKVTGTNNICKREAIKTPSLNNVKKELLVEFKKASSKVGFFLDFELPDLLVPEVSIKVEEERELKYSGELFNCQVKLVRCDGELKAKVEPSFEKVTLESCHVVLFRCDSLFNKIEPKCERDYLILPKGEGTTKQPSTKALNKTVPCYLCKKMFSSKSTMLTHLNLHTGEKPYKCSECPKAFSQRCRLRIHARTHTGERPYQCALCFNRFTAKTCLIYHVRAIHTGERPVSCPKCDKRFIDRSALSGHMKRMHARQASL